MHPDAGDDPAGDGPYRGLRALDAEDGGLFFGRQAEVDELVDRLRGQPMLLVAGQSGVGKSSLVRAGLGPAVARGALGERPAWDVVSMVPGLRPIDSLAAGMAPVSGRDQGRLSEALRRDPELAARLGRVRGERGMLLVVDQLEETLTLPDPAARAAFVRILERFSTLTPGVRLVMTVRSDFLGRLGELGPLGRGLLAMTYACPPMSRDGLRLAITAPARARGFEFESEAMVDRLVAEVGADAGALPALSFVLAELWRERDAARKVLPEAALARLGGAAQALARHGDLVLATLQPEARTQARRILLALVTGARTRARRTRYELIGDEGAPAQAALTALVRGRLVVVGETYDLAHEALVHAWPRLRAWLDEASEGHAAAARREVAAREWERLGRRRELLWRGRQLLDLELAGPPVAGSVAASFAEASRAAARAARVWRRVRWVAVPTLVAVAGASAWGEQAARRRTEVARALADSGALAASAEAPRLEAAAARAAAFAQFDRDDLGAAEPLWKRSLELEERTERARRDATVALDRALVLDPASRAAHARYADLTFARLLAAERAGSEALGQSLRARLAMHDDGTRAAVLDAPGRLEVETEPAGAALTLARYVEDSAGRLVEQDAGTLLTGAARQLEPGSLLVIARAVGRVETRYPLVLHRGEARAVRIVLPAEADVPPGMVYVPAGRFVYGSAESESLRAWQYHQPARELELPAFLVARTEVTFGEYLAFLRALPAAERAAHLPAGLTLADGGPARLTVKKDGAALGEGEPFCNGGLPCVDWARLPVDRVSRLDGEAYARWLSVTGRLPGARLCTDREWERAARGADARVYPGGNASPAPGESCSLEAFGGDQRRAGPCEGGSHPAVRSVFGVEDMSGSEAESVAGTADIAHPEQVTARGGAWNDRTAHTHVTLRAADTAEGDRWAGYGLRLCAR